MSVLPMLTLASLISSIPRSRTGKCLGSIEAIFRGPSADFNGSNWNTSKVFGPKVDKVDAHDNVIHQPTANLIAAYGMANGKPAYIVENGKLVPNILKVVSILLILSRTVTHASITTSCSTASSI